MMRRRALALLLLLPGCLGETIPAPPPGALDQAGPSGPHTAVATRGYPLPAARLFTARTEPLTAYADRLEASFVARSRIFGFPDVILLRVTPQGEAASTLTLHSSSLYGYSDFGVNGRRLEHWLARLGTVLPP
jgi:hypothetical protein